MGGLVELDRALGILAEHAVDDTDVASSRVPGASGGHPMVVGRIRILAVSLFFNGANEVIVPGFLPI